MGRKEEGGGRRSGKESLKGREEEGRGGWKKGKGEKIKGRRGGRSNGEGGGMKREEGAGKNEWEGKFEGEVEISGENGLEKRRKKKR